MNLSIGAPERIYGSEIGEYKNLGVIIWQRWSRLKEDLGESLG